MGADIHMVLEKKTEDLGWVGVVRFSNAPAVDDDANYVSYVARSRDYELFAHLAGVRGPGPDPKGLPEDASSLTHLELDDGSDLHSHTWWMLGDALPLFAVHQLGAAMLEPGIKDKAMRLFGLYEGEDDLNDYRLCIAFDN